MAKTTLYSARRILTMNRRQPDTTHVAVRDGMILGTGSLEELTGWGDFDLDERFADKVLMPGFVEGHAHSWEGSAWIDTYVGHFDRTAPDRLVHNGLKSIDEVVARLQGSSRKTDDADSAIFGWGMDPIFFDRRMTATDLDRVSSTRPVAIVHQSGHTINVNSFLLAKAGITRDTDVMGLVKDAEGDITGELQGMALASMAFRAAGRTSFLDDSDPDSLWRFARSAQIAGVTTATDLANELSQATVDTQLAETQKTDFPLRIVPAFLAMSGPHQDNVDWVISLQAKNHEKLKFGMIKLITDGSIQGFTARLKWPGYFNGADNGLWYIDPTALGGIISTYHRAGLQVHIHTNGDEAIEAAIDAVEQVLREMPNADARITLQHCQMAHDAHFRRMAKLGICANLFSNHLYYLGDQHYELTMGPERAERIDATATAGRLGVAYTIHSDAPVTHLSPLFTAWCAVNRLTASGRVLGPAECISVADALHAITLGAAYTLKMDHEIGSIEAGKRADFCVLDDDPLDVDPRSLKDISVWGTVLGGRVFPVADIPTA